MADKIDISEEEKAILCLKFYKNGEAIMKICNLIAPYNNNKVMSRKVVENYIKIANFLHPDLLKYLTKGGDINNIYNISTTYACYLIKTYPEYHKEIYDKLKSILCVKNKIKILQNWYDGLRYPRLYTSINHISRIKTNNYSINELEIKYINNTLKELDSDTLNNILDEITTKPSNNIN